MAVGIKNIDEHRGSDSLLSAALNVHAQLYDLWAGSSQLLAVDRLLIVSSILDSPYQLTLASASSCLLFSGCSLLRRCALRGCCGGIPGHRAACTSFLKTLVVSLLASGLPRVQSSRNSLDC